MSAFGPKQTWALALHMSAFGGKADMTVCTAHTVMDKTHDVSARVAKKPIRGRHSERIEWDKIPRWGPPMSIQSAYEDHAAGRVVLLSVATVVLLIFAWTFIN